MFCRTATGNEFLGMDHMHFCFNKQSYILKITTNQLFSFSRQECRTEIEVSHRTEYDDVCETVPERQCHPVVKQVPEKECHTTHEKVCTTVHKTIYEHSYTQECKPVSKEV